MYNLTRGKTPRTTLEVGRKNRTDPILRKETGRRGMTYTGLGDE